MDNDEEPYDSFGNYVGPELASDDDDEVDPSSEIVLAEDKRYFSTADEVFGPGTEALVEEEDTQQISEPLVAPKRNRVTVLTDSSSTALQAHYDHEYLASAILPTPTLCRNVAVIGNLHHGKTVLCDMLFRNSHDMPWPARSDEPLRYMDTRPDEQQMKISVKSVASTFLLPSLCGKSYGVTVIDTPGHPNFIDEAIAGMNLADGAIAMVDAAEGLGLGAELLLKRAAQMRLDIVLVVSKIDRLILELRLPPADAYHKIRHLIDAANEIIAPLGGRRLSPGRGNVAFTAATEQMCFTLQQFAGIYVEKHGGPLSAPQLAKRLWGDAYYDVRTKRFTKERPSSTSERTFVEFVLTPLYKLHTAVVSDDVSVLAEKLDRNNISISSDSLESDVKCLMRTIVGSSFGLGNVSGLVDMIVSFVRSPFDSAARKIESMGISCGGHTSERGTKENMEWIRPALECRSSRDDPLVAYVGKLVERDKGDGETVEFLSLCRVLSGEIRCGDRVRVLGDEYDVIGNEEEQAGAIVEGIFLACGRYQVEVAKASAGQVVLLKGVDETVFKSATIVSASHPLCAQARILRPLPEMLSPGVVKIAVEPVRPSELPKMVSGLRMCLKSYPGLTSKVEESGEHTLIGPGELYMDCVMRDLRDTFAEIEVKVSDPVVPFSETVTDTSALQCHADTPNKQNRLTMIAEPLEEGVLSALNGGRFGRISDGMDPDEVAATLRSLGWDSLAAKSLWSFGPHSARGPNALVNDILDPESRTGSQKVMDSVVQGFNWAMREGPLTDEPVRGVKVRVLDGKVASSPVSRSPAQLVPAARRAVYSSILTASPRLLEPVYLVEVTCPQSAIQAVYMIMQRRRGTALADGPVAGTSLFYYRGLVPVLDSFGLEADLRGLTDGQAFVVQSFDHWAVVPGDPLDRSVELRPLEPAGRRELARECLVKTRRRKGMSDDVSVVQYFDDPLLVELIRDDPELKQLL